MKQVLSNSWTCIYIPHINSVIVCLSDQGNGDYLTLVLGGRQEGAPISGRFSHLKEQVLSNPS